MKNEYEEYEDELDMYYMKYLAATNRAEKLINGPGGIMEMKQTIADKETLIEELLKSNWEKSWPTMRKYETFEEYRDSVLK
jgi:hypothetical protein